MYYLIAGTVPFAETVYCLRNFYAGCIWNRTVQGWFFLEYYDLGKRYMFLADFWFLLALLFAYMLFFIIADRVLRSKAKEAAAIVLLLAVTGILIAFASLALSILTGIAADFISKRKARSNTGGN